MGKIIAIGGGEIGREKDDGTFYPIETTFIDKEIIKLSNKKEPNFLFIPTASSDNPRYCQNIKDHFGKTLNCNVNFLKLINTDLNIKKIEEIILNSDIIYVGGGNTKSMLEIWNKLGVNKILKKAYNKGIILSGLSAGAICWFKYGCSDSLKLDGSSNELIKIDALGFENFLLCPHFDVEKDRKQALKQIMLNTGDVVAIAIDNKCAFAIIGNEFKVISESNNYNCYKCYYKDGVYFEDLINKNDFQKLN